MTWPHAFSFERRVPLRHYLPPEPKPPAPRKKRVYTPKPLRIPPPTPGIGQVPQILAEVAAEHGLNVAELKGGWDGSQTRAYAWPRQRAAYRLRQETKLSLPQIARALGLKNHTTVLHGIRAHAKRMEEGVSSHHG